MTRNTEWGDEPEIQHSRGLWIHGPGGSGPQPGPLPKVTKAEEMLYSTDLAPIIRLVGSSLADLHAALRRLSEFVNEARKMEGLSDDKPGEHPDQKRNLAAFAALAGPHDQLVDAHRTVAAIGIEAAKDQTPTTDTEMAAFVASYGDGQSPD